MMSSKYTSNYFQAQKDGEINSNLKGVGLGDSWISPIDSVLTWAPFLLETVICFAIQNFHLLHFNPLLMLATIIKNLRLYEQRIKIVDFLIMYL